MSTDEIRGFDWLDDVGDIVVPEQPAIACNPNPKGAIVLRQDTEDDHFVWFHPEHAAAVAAAILEAAGLDTTALIPEAAQVDSKSKDPSAAGRQRRYRERKKKQPTPEPDIFDRDVTRDVTDRNTVTPRDGEVA